MLVIPVRELKTFQGRVGAIKKDLKNGEPMSFVHYAKAIGEEPVDAPQLLTVKPSNVLQMRPISGPLFSSDEHKAKYRSMQERAGEDIKRVSDHYDELAMAVHRNRELLQAGVEKIRITAKGKPKNDPSQGKIAALDKAIKKSEKAIAKHIVKIKDLDRVYGRVTSVSCD